MASVLVLTQKGLRAIERPRGSDTEVLDVDIDLLSGISELEGMTPEELQEEFNIHPSDFRGSLRRLFEAKYLESIPEEDIGRGGVFILGRPSGEARSREDILAEEIFRRFQ